MRNSSAGLAAGLLAFAFAIAGPAGPVAAAPDIVGGSNATEPYGFMASMQSLKGKPSCGASLINPRWLVTAAHCVDEQDPAQWRFRIGSSDRNNGGELATSDKFVKHPKYDPFDTGDYDIALVHLKKPAKATPIPIAAASPAPAATARELGWGLTCPTIGCGDPPVQLQQLDTKVVRDQRCAQRGEPFDPARELCLDNNGGKGSTCFGDSGGPAIVSTARGWALVGAVSRGQSMNCTELPGIFTDITAHAGWIAERTGTARNA